MRKLLNTLFVTQSDAYLSRDGENVVVRCDDKELLRVPAINLEQINCFSYLGASPALMRLCVDNNINLSFFNQYGRFMARVTGPQKGNIFLRKKQYACSNDTAESTQIAKNMLSGKFANCRQVLLRGLRDHPGRINIEKVQSAANLLKQSYDSLIEADNLDDLRGIEGIAAQRYFQALDNLIFEDKTNFFMKTRNRRPPLDCFNTLLSFLYALLYADATAALEGVGLDAAAGFLHRDRPGRNSLALDIMEELRPYLADRLALTLVNRRQISAEDFETRENGAVLLHDKGRKQVLAAWQKRKMEEIRHPYIDEKIEIGLIAHIQALLLARFLRGDIEGYPPFIWR
jgi:CRISPR-associated protein Cas1